MVDKVTKEVTVTSALAVIYLYLGGANSVTLESRPAFRAGLTATHASHSSHG
jgi:hypothetical protein